MIPIFEKLDPIVLNSLYQISQVSKSTALAVTLLYSSSSALRESEKLSLADAVNIARVDEHF